MKKAAIICVGKLKTKYWQDACNHYLKQLRPWRFLECTEVRDSATSLAPDIRVIQESKRILAEIAPGDLPVALHERGKQLTSHEFAAFLRNCDEKVIKRPTFIIGGPFGLGKTVLDSCAASISLSPMTWTHEMARVLLLEQLYRAESILRRYPYHH